MRALGLRPAARDVCKTIIEELGRHGIQRTRVEHKGHRPAVLAEVRGRTLRIPFPLDGGGHRSGLNARAQARRLCRRLQQDVERLTG